MIDHGRRDRAQVCCNNCFHPLLSGRLVFAASMSSLRCRSRGACRRRGGISGSEAASSSQSSENPCKTRDRFVTCRSNEKLAPSLTQPAIPGCHAAPGRRAEGVGIPGIWPLSACWARSAYRVTPVAVRQPGVVRIHLPNCAALCFGHSWFPPSRCRPLVPRPAARLPT